jgi:hypothetical protein
VRTLTDAEARVIAVLLAARPDRERERLHQVQIPRSTYHAVRRRAYQELWLRDRYIPHPVPIGRPFVTFLLARPFADRSEEFLREVAGDAGDAVLWASGQVVLGVLFHPKPTDGARWRKRIEEERFASGPVLVTVEADGPSVPVYFDFEGLWCHLAGLPGTLAYPHGLGGALAPGDGEDGAQDLTPHRRWAVGELLKRPFEEGEGARGPHLAGPFGLPFAQRRMLARGWVDHRTLLDPAPLPSYQGRSPDAVVLIHGAPRSGARPEELFATLTRECRVFPFLFVVGDERWILGALGAGAPVLSDAGPPRRPVLATLREYLEGIEIVQEPSARFVARVDHRYDRLLPLETKSGGKRA